jgi:outer membrane protein assembly factor BamB
LDNRNLPPTCPWIKLAVAWLVSLGLLPYALGRCWKGLLLDGRTDGSSVAAILFGVLATAALTRGGSREKDEGTKVAGSRTGPVPPHPGPLPEGEGALPNRRAQVPQLAWLLTLAGWLLANGLVAATLAGPLLPRAYVILLFVAGSLPLGWSAWMFAWPCSMRLRLAVLVALLPLPIATGLLLKTDGLTGDGKLNFAWRWTVRDRRSALDDRLAATDSRRPRRPIRLMETPDDYPQFLGPERQAVVPGARLTDDWQSGPPRLVWRQGIGAGWGSFAVVGEYAFTQEQRADDECVVCYRVATGEEIWCHADRQSFESTAGLGPRATPAVARNRVYALGAAGLLNCLDAPTGRACWSVNILADNRAQNLAHGLSGSPLLADDLVIVSPTGGNGISLAAYRQQTGKRVWHAGRWQASYSSPMLASFGHVPQVVLFTSMGVESHEIRTGRTLWSFPWTNSQRINCSQPIVGAGGPDQLFVSTAYGTGSVLLRITHLPDERWQPEARWQSRSLACGFSTMVIREDCLYGLDAGRLVCLDLASGRRLWKQGRYDSGQLLMCGDRLLVQAESGEMYLLNPSRQGPRELGHFSALEGKTWNTPVVTGPYLLVRNDHLAACYRLP